MDDQHAPSIDEIKEFVKFVKNPLPEIVPDWDRVSLRRQRIVHMYVLQGMGHKEIAYELSIEVSTVKNHMYEMQLRTGKTCMNIKDDVMWEIRRRADELIKLS